MGDGATFRVGTLESHITLSGYAAWSRQVSEAGQRWERLGAQLAQTGPANRVERSLEQIVDRLDALGDASDRTTSAIRAGFGIAADNTDDAADKIVRSLERIERQSRETTQRVQRDMGGGGAGGGGLMASFAGGFAGGIVASAAFDGLERLRDLAFDVARGGYEAVSSYEALTDTLENLTARELMQTGAATSMTEALAMSKREVESLMSFFDQLPASVQRNAEAIYQMALNYNFSSETARGLTTALADYTAATNRTVQQTESIARALGQINARGKLSAEEINQLAEAGLTVQPVLEEMGYTLDDVSKGLVEADGFIQAVVESLERDFGGAAERQEGKLNGLVAALDRLKELRLRDLFTEAFEEAQPALVRLKEGLESDAFQSAVLELGEHLGDAVARLVEFAESVSWARIHAQASLIADEIERTNANLSLLQGGLTAGNQAIAIQNAVNAASPHLGRTDALRLEMALLRGDGEAVREIVEGNAAAASAFNDELVRSSVALGVASDHMIEMYEEQLAMGRAAERLTEYEAERNDLLWQGVEAYRRQRNEQEGLADVFSGLGTSMAGGIVAPLRALFPTDKLEAMTEHAEGAREAAQALDDLRAERARTVSALQAEIGQSERAAAEAITTINQRLATDLAEIQADRREAYADAAADRIDIEADTADRIRDLERELQKDLDDLNQDAAEDYADYLRDKADAERDYTRSAAERARTLSQELADIEQRYSQQASDIQYDIDDMLGDVAGPAAELGVDPERLLSVADQKRLARLRRRLQQAQEERDTARREAEEDAAWEEQREAEKQAEILAELDRRFEEEERKRAERQRELEAEYTWDVREARETEREKLDAVDERLRQENQRLDAQAQKAQTRANQEIVDARARNRQRVEDLQARIDEENRKYATQEAKLKSDWQQMEADYRTHMERLGGTTDTWVEAMEKLQEAQDGVYARQLRLNDAMAAMPAPAMPGPTTAPEPWYTPPSGYGPLEQTAQRMAGEAFGTSAPRAGATVQITVGSLIGSATLASGLDATQTGEQIAAALHQTLAQALAGSNRPTGGRGRQAYDSL